MPQLTRTAVRQQIQAGRTDPLYLILGDDDVERANLAAEFTETVEEGLRAFNIERLYGGEAEATALVDAARTLPMMAPRRIILVLNAERLLFPSRETQQTERNLEVLAVYFASPEPHATVIFVASMLDRRRRIAKLLLEHATIVQCGSIESVDEARRWVKQRAAAQSMTIEPSGIALLVDRATRQGPNREVLIDAGGLRADTDRLLLYAMGETVATLGHVNDIIGVATSKHAFAVTNAMERGATAEALRELALLFDSGAVPVMVLGQLGWFVRSKLHGPQVRTAVEAVLRTDLALKTSAGDHRVLLERLVVELCDEKLRAKVAPKALLF